MPTNTSTVFEETKERIFDNFGCGEGLLADKDYAKNLKKSINEQKAKLSASKRAVVQMKERAKATAESTKKYCEAELDKLNNGIDDVTCLIDFFIAWVKEPIVPTDWVSNVNAIEKRGIPLLSKSSVVAKTTFEQKLKLHFLYNEVARASIHLSNVNSNSLCYHVHKNGPRNPSLAIDPNSLTPQIESFTRCKGINCKSKNGLIVILLL